MGLFPRRQRSVQLGLSLLFGLYLGNLFIQSALRPEVEYWTEDRDRNLTTYIRPKEDTFLQLPKIFRVSKVSTVLS